MIMRYRLVRFAAGAVLAILGDDLHPGDAGDRGADRVVLMLAVDDDVDEHAAGAVANDRVVRDGQHLVRRRRAARALPRQGAARVLRAHPLGGDLAQAGAEILGNVTRLGDCGGQEQCGDGAEAGGSCVRHASSLIELLHEMSFKG